MTALLAAVLATAAAFAAPQTAGFADDDIAVLAKAAIVSDARTAGLSADDLERAANVRPDLDVARDVRVKLVGRLGPALASFSVTCHRGEVVLEGKARDLATRDAAGAAAAEVAGVHRVENKLRVPDAPAPVDPPEEPADEEAEAEPVDDPTAPFAFLTRDGLAARDVTLAVSSGEVTVTGHASSGAAREYVTAAIRRVPGAKSVVNRMTARTVDPSEDRRLGDIVAAKIRWSEPLRPVASGLSVSVKDGVVRLTGRVATEEQAHVLLGLASSTVGVVVVDDRVAAPGR